MQKGKNGMRRVAALVCSVALFATLLPVQVLATDEGIQEPLTAVTLLNENGEETVSEQGDADNQQEEAVACTKDADCAAETHEEDCPKYVAPDEDEGTDPAVSCTKSEDCQADTHEEGCSKNEAQDEEGTTEPAVSCTKDENCAAETHEEGCPKNGAVEQEQIVAGSNLEVAITDEDMAAVTDGTTAIAAALSRMQIEDVTAVTSLKVTTEGNAYLSPEDNMYIKQNFTALTYLDESNCRCSTRVLTESYLEKSGLENIEYEEFGGLSGFSSLETLLIPETAQVINSYTLSERGGGIDSTGLTTLTIPDSVLAFESGACSGIISFTGNLIIPNSVVFIGNNAFGAGTSIIDCGTLTLGNSVEYIDANGFKSRKFTGNLVIPDSVEFIGNWAFAEGSFANETWTLGAGLHQIGSAAMNGICSGNTGTFTILTKWKLGSAAFKNNSFDKVVFEEGYVDISTVQVIANSTKITEIVLPSTLKSISGRAAFSGCSALSAINLPEGLETIGVRVFENDDALTSVVLPSTLTTIGDSAFEDSGIVGAYIPASVTTIGNRVFQDIPSGSTIYMANDTLLSAMTTSNSDWNKKYNAKNTALAVTNGGTFAADDTFTAGELATPTKDGAIFEGWYESATFEGDAVTSAKAGKTYYAKWTGMDDMELQYGAEQKIAANGVENLSGYESDNTSVATVDAEGNVKAVGVGTATISATGTYNEESTTTFKMTVTVTPRPINYTLTNNETGSGSITYNYSDEHHALSDSMTFKWADEPETVVSLTEGADINYTYTVVDQEAPDGGEPLTYDYLPMPVGEYDVSFNLKNPNYTFALDDGTTGNTLTVKVNVTAEGTQRAYLASAAPRADQNFVYNGQGVLPVEGTLNAYAENDSSTSPVKIGTFTVNIEGLNGTSYHSEMSDIAAGTDLSGISGLKLPTEPGTYIITASAVNEDYYLYKSLVFTINKATVTITAADKTVITGDSDGLPPLTSEDYTVTGLVGNDKLTTPPTLDYEYGANVDTVGTYDIIPSGAAANADRYTIQYVKGTLHVEKIAIIEGADQTWTQGSGNDLVIRSNADFSDFLRVEVNGNALVRDQDYTVRSGSTIVTIKAAYLDTLAAGDYTFAIVSKTGTASTHFTVKAKAAGESGASGNTGAATTTPAPSGSNITYYTCPACGYHDWTATAEGYKCNHCGYVESAKQLSGYGNVKGVYEPKTSAAAAQSVSSSAIPQTGDVMPIGLMGGVTVIAAAAFVALFVLRKRQNND